MKHPLVPLLPVMLAAHVALADDGVAFGPVRAQPGESVRLTSRSETRDGVVETTLGGRTTRETLRFYRERDLSWTFREPGPDGSRRGMVDVGKMATYTSIISGGREEKTEELSPLSGKMFAMSKPPEGDWTFELDGSIPSHRIQQEIDELTVYLKRRWYPERIVRIGDSWEFDPAWIRMILQKDLERAKLIGTMKLRQVRHTAQKHLAVIDVSVRGSGGSFQADGSEEHAKLELNGRITVDLKTMLDESYELDGILEKRSSKTHSSTKATLPVRIVVNKSFAKGAGF